MIASLGILKAMKKILVTGGAGYIGSHTVVELIEAGYTPVIIDNLSNSERSVIKNLSKLTGKNISFYENNFEDQKALTKIIEKEKIEGVIHFAAYKAVGESVHNPIKYYLNNVSGLINLMKVLEENNIQNLVFSSSCTVYGEAYELPITESSAIKPPVSPYGATKQMGEQIIKDVTHSSKALRSLSLRYFNPIGAHPSALIGELPIGKPSILVPFITQTVAGWHKELTVFGDNYPTPDGTCIRDYIHVVDLAKAHVQSLKYLSSQQTSFYDAINIGTGVGSSVLEVIKTFEKLILLKCLTK